MGTLEPLLPVAVDLVFSFWIGLKPVKPGDVKNISRLN